MNGGGSAFHMMLIARKAGWYGYIIGRSDDSAPVKRSLESFSSIAEAAKAGRRAMEIEARKLAEQRQSDAG
jgi:hypothetical protein